MTMTTAHHHRLGASGARPAHLLDRVAVRFGLLLVRWGRRERLASVRETALLRREVERTLREEAARRAYDVFG